MRRISFCSAWLFVLALFGAGGAVADCPDTKVLCVKQVNGKIFTNGYVDANGRLPNEGNCWTKWQCRDCSGDTWAMYAANCNSRFPACEGACATCPLYHDIDAITQDPCYDKNGTQHDPSR